LTLTRRHLAAACAAVFAILSCGSASLAGSPQEIRLDWATYNPLSIVLKAKGFLEQELAADGIKVRWIQSAGSNKALEFLNAGSLDFGSTAGSAALLGKINGNPVKVVDIYSRPEWTALVTRHDSAIATPADLKGKSVAVTRGTDAYVFLVRALDDVGLTEKDVRLVLLQHADGKLALLRGDVDAWAGLDPMMAAAELEAGAKLFYRRVEANTWGTLCVREAFAAEHPALVAHVLRAYEKARAFARENPAELAALLAAATKLPAAVVARQLARTDLNAFELGAPQRESITAAGQALLHAGIIKPGVDIGAAVNALVDPKVN
jgi:sulfonate transport system substrate-binding protein